MKGTAPAKCLSREEAQAESFRHDADGDNPEPSGESRTEAYRYRGLMKAGACVREAGWHREEDSPHAVKQGCMGLLRFHTAR